MVVKKGETEKNYFGGGEEGDTHFDNAHGICFDPQERRNSVVITDGTETDEQVPGRSSQLLDIIRLPGACVLQASE